MTVTTLPRSAPVAVAPTARWSPSRAGLLNVWRYYDEVLTFSGGRLLLRGANGTGKSKALELLLPFLLDASLRAQRLSTFGTGERTMHWNLMGEGASGVTRVGYVWVEFRGPDEQWFTGGARLQATAHRSEVGVDYFTTSRRVGHDLALTTDAGAPLTKAQLDEALGEAGTRHGSAADYRSAVRRELFPGMSEERYDALITALLQLRTPKLSQRLDPALLSTLLSRALPPLGENEVTDLAEGFERLDRQREHLARLDQEVAAARDIAARQRTYARRVLRAGAAAVISATSDMDGRTRAARRSEAEHAEAVAGSDDAENRLRDLTELVEATTTRLDALRDSPAYQQGTALEDLRTQLRAASAAATTARERVSQAERAAAADAGTAEDARRRAGTVEGLCTTRRDEAAAAAHDAGLGTTAARVEDALADPDRRDRARSLAQAAVESRRDQVREVGRRLDGWERAVERRTEVEVDLDHARVALADATTTRTAASDRFDTALTAQAERLEQWAGATRELTGIDVDALLAAAESESRVLGVVRDAEQRARRALDLDEAGRAARRAELAAEQVRVRTERDRVEAERDVPPPVPATRTADRTGRAGAPLWRLVTFVDGVDDARQAAVEAALEASGLLDAWVSPSGAVELEGHDTRWHAIDPAPGPSLLEVVVPEADGAVEPEHLRRLLGAVAYGGDLDAHSAVISPDGRFRLATLTGSWSKPRAAHIGATAREQARRRRLEELAAELSVLGSAVAEVNAALSALARRRGVLDAECAARPDHRELDQARVVLTRAEMALAEADGAVRRWMQRRSDAEGAVTAALRALSALAAEHGLPTVRDALDELDRAVGVFGRLAEVWIGIAAEARHARETATRAAEHAQRSRDAAVERTETAEDAEAEARRLGERVASIERTVGVEYREVMARIAATNAERETARGQEHATRSALRVLDTRIGELEAARLGDARRRDEAVAARDAAAETFRTRCLLGLPADAGIELAVSSDGTRMTLETARTVASAWAEVPHTAAAIAQAFGRLTETLHGSRDVLAGRADLSVETEDDVQVLRAVVDGRTLGASALLARVEAEAERSRSDITAAERELFDTTLTGETRRHLAARIREADALVRGMNERLTGVRTASRVAVRLRWTMADDVSPGTRSARDLLLRDPVRLSADDRASLHRFFRDRIDAARAEGTAGNWEQQLAEVFDYTRWHQFVVEIDRGDGHDWQKLTKKLHGALSGGEKAIALHLPLFAAVAAYYESVPRGPRLILLDEVFVGVDAINRGQVFGLLAALDLDLVLTSDHEWCTYRELDDIAIHQLITGAADEDDAVTTARFVWNGHELQEDG